MTTIEEIDEALTILSEAWVRTQDKKLIPAIDALLDERLKLMK